MFLKILKSNQPVVLILLAILCGLLWIKTFIFQNITEYPFDQDQMPLYELIFGFLSKNKIIYISAGFLLLIIQSLYLTRLNYKYIFLEGRTYMPSILFIILSCGIIKLQGLHPAIIANLALILTIDKIFFSYRKEKVLSVLFDASLILSVGSLFYFDIIFFVIIIWTGLIILRTFNWREWVITITGLITPYILVFSYYYIFDDINYIREIIVSNVFVSRTDPGLNMSYYIFFSYLLLLIIISTVSMFVRFGLKKISTRKYFTIILWLFLFSMIFLAVLRSMSIEVLVIAAVPASYLLSNYFISLRSRWWGDILFLVLIGLIIYIQVVN